jgi:hypothetical protein
MLSAARARNGARSAQTARTPVSSAAGDGCRAWPGSQPADLDGATTEVVRRQPGGTWKYLIDHSFGALNATG